MRKNNRQLREECLYRARTLNTGEWVAGYYVRLRSEKEIIHRIYLGYAEQDGNDFYPDYEDVDYSTVSRITGLKDTNGVRIWENSIVDFFGYEGTIVFVQGSFGISFDVDIDWDMIKEKYYKDTEIDCSPEKWSCDTFIPLWEILSNFECEGNCVDVVKVIGNIFNKEN